MTAPVVASRRGPGALWLLASAVTFWSFGYTEMMGSDLWWHVASGRWILEHPRWPLRDPWSFTHQGGPWLHHEWLADVLYAVWTARFGLESLVYWKWGLLVATFVLLFRQLAQESGSPAAGYLSTLLAAATAAPFLDIRPHLYSLLGYVALLVLVASDRPRPIALPLLFLLWANLHGGVLFGLLALTWLLLVSPPSRWRTPRLWLSCLLASLCNPNGIGVIAYPLEYALAPASPFRALAEWLPPFVPGGIECPLYLPALAIAALAAVYHAVSPAKRARALPGLGLVAATLAMSFTSRRFIPLFALSQALLLAPLLARWSERCSRAWPRLARFAPALPLLALGLGLRWLLPYPQRPYAFHYLTAEYSYPVDTLDFIEVNGLAGDVFADYRWGGYLHLRTSDRLRVFVDGRADTVFDAETYGRYLQVLRMDADWTRLVEASGARYFLWPRTTQVDVLQQTGRWRLLHQDSVSALLVRDGVPLPPLRPPVESAYRELWLGTSLLDQGQPRRAARHFEQALDLLPYLGPACGGLALAQLHDGRRTEALATLLRCDRIFPQPERVARFRNWAAAGATAPSSRVAW